MSPWVRYPGPVGLNVFPCKPDKRLYGSWERCYVSCPYPDPIAVSNAQMSYLSAQVSRSGSSPSEYSSRSLSSSTTRHILLLCRDLSFLPYTLVLRLRLLSDLHYFLAMDVIPFCRYQGTAHPFACTSPSPLPLASLPQPTGTNLKVSRGTSPVHFDPCCVCRLRVAYGEFLLSSDLVVKRWVNEWTATMRQLSKN